MVRSFPTLLIVCGLVAGCGGGGAVARNSGVAASSASANVDISGKAVQRGTRGAVLVFAYTDLAANDDPSTHEPASVGIVEADGSFDLAVPGGGATTLVFLADGANDGVIDPRDSTARLSAPELADLQPGDRVHIGDAAIDFTHRQVTATIEVARANEPAVTPTSIPAAS